MLQEFFINEIEESIESDELYAVMNKRINNFKNSSISEEEYAYGPGDICYLVKEIQTKGFLGLRGKKVTKIGSYHCVYGLDTSNIAYISAYISKFIQKLNCSNSKITQSIFCVYDYFTEKDLRILIKFPGGIRKIFYIDDGEATEANPDELRTVFLSSVLRSWSLKKLKSNDLILEELNNTNAFNYLIQSIHLLVKENSEIKNENSAVDKKIIHLVKAFLKYLIHTRRFNIAISNFSKLSSVDCNLIRYAIEPLTFLQLYPEALAFIATAVLDKTSLNSQYFDLLNLQIDVLLKLSKYEDALEIATFVTSNKPEVGEYWISLANVYLKKNDFSSCLKVLNNVYVLSESRSKRDINNTYSNSQREYASIKFEEISVAKNKINTYSIKYSQIIFAQKNIVDIFYSSSRIYICDNLEFINETVNKILTSQFYKFDKEQKKIYFLLLDMIKEINFDIFLELRDNIFFPSVNVNTNDPNLFTEVDSLFSTDRGMMKKDSSKLQSTELNKKDKINKIATTQNFGFITDHLIEDLKVFGMMISENEEYFNMLYHKEELSVTEIKFFISIGILSERLRYYNTSINFYTKASQHCRSRFVYIRMIKIYAKIKEYKNAMSTLTLLLSYIPSSQFKSVNRTSHWLDKIMLEILHEHEINEIISWISNSPIHIIEFIIKRITQKYLYWIDAGHELDLKEIK